LGFLRFRKLIAEKSVSLMEALAAAVELEQLELLEQLLEDLTDINMRCEETGLTLLHKAASTGTYTGDCLKGQ